MNQQDSNIFSIGLVKSNQFKKVSCQMTLLLYGVFCRFKSHPGGRLVADARNQQPFEPGKWGLRVVLSGHFCISPIVEHARRKQASIRLQEYLPELQILLIWVGFFKQL